MAIRQVTQTFPVPNCYLCGRPLNESRTRLRRKVKTGEWVKRAYGSGKVAAVTNRYGPRIVCAGCAKRLDLRDFQSERWQRMQLAFWLVVLVVVYLTIL